MSQPTVVVRGGGSGYGQEIEAGAHRLRADEPVAAGGGDSGPSPYDLLLAALGACTSMTLGAYARIHHWPLQAVRVELRHAKVYADDCAGCDAKAARLDRIEREIQLAGELSGAQRARLLEIADRCPVHRTLQAKVEIRTRLLE
ncbi:MAG TPA: OsmC family protein [Terriglobales bacterium]|nr:OsmC family protein [Terriglobales bacterium]